MPNETGYRPRTHQAEIHEALKRHRFGVLVCHRRFGKTVCAVNALIDAALRFPRNDGRFGYVAPYLKQAKRIAWPYLKKYTEDVPGCVPHEQDLILNLANGNQISVFGADNPDAMRGDYFDGVVPDEMADMRPQVWGNVLRPMLADRKGWSLFIGTPKGMNIFYELYEQAQRDAGWYAGMYRADETGIIPESELKLARAAMSEAQYRQEFLCDFSASLDNVLITIDMVSEACSRAEVCKANLEGLPQVVGVDVARFGDDRSVIARRHGHVCYEPEVFSGVDNMQLAGMVAQRCEKWKPDAVFIDGGRGEGVIDRLRQIGFDPVEVNFGGTATNPHYFNKRAEMWGTMGEWIQENGVLPRVPELKTDLCVPTYSFAPDNRMKLESKDAIRARGGRSPDLADALALTFAFPVMPAETVGWQGNAGQVVSDYDPYPQREVA